MRVATPTSDETAQAVDTERLNWLEKEFEARGCVSFDRYGPGKAGCELFTVSSQHVRGYMVRGAIDAAMAETGKGEES